MDSDNLEKLYSCGDWSNRFKTGQETIADHVQFCKRVSHDVRQALKFETISYGNASSEIIDIYGADLPDGKT